MTSLHSVSNTLNPVLRSLPFEEAVYAEVSFKPDEMSLLVAHQFFDACHDEVITCPNLQDHLEERGIGGTEIRELCIGFSSRTFSQRIPHKDSPDGARYRHIKKELGLMNALGRETARGCFTYPLYTPNGTLNGVYLERKQCPGSVAPERVIIWDKNSSAIFNYRALPYSDEVIVTSSPSKAARLRTQGYCNVIAIVSEQYTLEELIRLFRQLRVSKIYIYSELSKMDKSFRQQVRKALKATKTPHEDFAYGV